MTRGKRRNCLDMTLDFTKKCHVGLDMACHQEDMDKEFSDKTKPNSEDPLNEALFKIDDDSPQLSEEKW